jgi:hypothetical protein
MGRIYACVGDAGCTLESFAAMEQRDTRDYARLPVDHMSRAVDEMAELQVAIDSLDSSAFAHPQHYQPIKGGNASRVYLEMESR